MVALARTTIARTFAAAVLVAIAVGCGTDDPTSSSSTGRDRPRKKSASAARPTEGSSPRSTSPPPAAVADCSAAGMPGEPPEQRGLSPEAAAMRHSLVAAAVACDFDELARLGLDGEGGFHFSFGAGSDPAAYWRSAERHGEPVLESLVTIMGLPYVEDDIASGGRGKDAPTSYSWPSAYQAEPSDEDWQALVDAGLYTQEQVDQMRAGGSGYLGWRAGITSDGDWVFFVAGD